MFIDQTGKGYSIDESDTHRPAGAGDPFISSPTFCVVGFVDLACAAHDRSPPVDGAAY